MKKVNSPYHTIACGILLLFSDTAYAASRKNPGYAATTQSSRSRTQTNRPKTARPRPKKISTSSPSTQTAQHQQSTSSNDQRHTAAQPDAFDDQKVHAAENSAASAAAAAAAAVNATASHHNTPSRLSPQVTPGSSSNSSPESSPIIGTRRTTQTTSGKKLAAALAQARADRLRCEQKATAATAPVAPLSSSKIKKPGNGNAPTESRAAQVLHAAAGQRAQEKVDSAPTHLEAEQKAAVTTKNNTAREQSKRTVKILFYPNPGSDVTDVFEGIPETTQTKALAQELCRRMQQIGLKAEHNDFSAVRVTKANLPLFLNGQATLDTTPLLKFNQLVELPGGRYDPQHIYITFSSHEMRAAFAKAYQAALIPKELEVTAPPLIPQQPAASAACALTLLERLRGLTGSAPTTPPVSAPSFSSALHTRTSSAPPASKATSSSSSSAASSAAAAAAARPHQASPATALAILRNPAPSKPIERSFLVDAVLGQITLPSDAQRAAIQDAITKKYIDVITQQFLVFSSKTDQPVDSFADRAVNEDIILSLDEKSKAQASRQAQLTQTHAEFGARQADQNPPPRNFLVDQVKGKITLQQKEESAAAIKAKISRICAAQHRGLLPYPFLRKKGQIVLQAQSALLSLRGRPAHEGVALLDPQLVEDNAYEMKPEAEWGTEPTASSCANAANSVSASAAAAHAAALAATSPARGTEAHRAMII
jgi:hypothetical protein